MDSKGRPDIYVLTIAATNRPWDLDSAVLSRFEKKILIPLPDETTREKILRIHLEKKGFQTEVPFDELSRLTAGYSGREIELGRPQIGSLSDASSSLAAEPLRRAPAARRIRSGAGR